MRVEKKRSTVVAPDSERFGPRLRPASVFDSDKAAGALAGFLEEAKEILERVEDSYLQGEGRTPFARARRDVLRFLAGVKDEVEVSDLPILSSLGSSRGKTLVRQLAEERLMVVDRNETYPNMMYLRISSAGREELRQIGVREAMAWLHGVNCDVSDAVGNARNALNRLVEAIAA